MRWSEILPCVEVEHFTRGTDPEIAGVEYDSRRVQSGSLFVAMRGGTADGNRFTETSLQSGASAVITDDETSYEKLHARGIASALVKHGRHALADAATVFYDAPQRKLKVTAVTGTNGKTTTAFLLTQLLESTGRKVLLMGTVETRIAGERRESSHTTPEASDLIALFANAVQAGCTEVVMEASSHALEQGRMWAVPVDVAVFTNLTQDHLDYHGSMEAYARAKMRLFTAEGTGVPPRVSVINEQAAYAGRFLDAYEGEEFLVRYDAQASEGGNHCAENNRSSSTGTRFDFVTPAGRATIDSPLIGGVNVENLLAAMCAALARGLTLEEIAQAVPKLSAAPGRFEVVSSSRELGFSVIVDYAHTPDALENLCAIAREQVHAAGGRVLTMFGCGGDRDRTKRPLMGFAAARGSDFVVVTSDNPRSEGPQVIVDEIVAGVVGSSTPFVVELDRRAAIKIVIREARPGDMVLLAGKGHEKTQTFDDRVEPFDDVAEAGRVLRSLLPDKVHE